MLRGTCDVFIPNVFHVNIRVFSNGYGKQVPVLFDISTDLADRIITDEEWLWQMILNLLTNACKYTDRGEIVAKVSLSSGSTDHSKSFEDEMLLVEVIDSGSLTSLSF